MDNEERQVGTLKTSIYLAILVIGMALAVRMLIRDWRRGEIVSLIDVPWRDWPSIIFRRAIISGKYWSIVGIAMLVIAIVGLLTR